MRRTVWAGIVVAVVFVIGGPLQAVDPCDNNACCVNPASCVVTDRQTLDSISVNGAIDARNLRDGW